MPHYQGSSWLGHGSDVGLPPRPTYGGVSPLMQQLIGETPEGAGLGLGVEPSWMGLGPVRDPRMTQQVQETGVATRPTFTGVSDIYDALAAKQISRAQAQAYLERLMTPAQARNLLDENFPVGTEESEPVSAAATPTWNTPSEVYASVRDNPQLYWDGVEALVGLGLNRGGSMDYLGPLIEGYTGGVNGGPTRDQTLDAEGALRQQAAAAAEGRAYKGFDQPYQTSGRVAPFSRGEELDLQRQFEPRAVYSRIMQTIPGFSEFSPGVQGAIENRFGDVFTRARMAQVAQPTLGFEEFLGGAGAFGRGDPNLLRKQLHGLQSFLGSPSGTDFGYQTGIREAFDEPENILRAILQPGLAEIAPSLRGYFAKGAEREFERFRASQPEADVLGEFARRKFF